MTSGFDPLRHAFNGQLNCWQTNKNQARAKPPETSGIYQGHELIGAKDRLDGNALPFSDCLPGEFFCLLNTNEIRRIPS